MATNPRQAERESSDLGHETRKTADQAGQTGRTMVDAAERTTRAGAEAFQRNTEGVKETLQGGAEAGSRIAQRSMEQFSRMFGLNGQAARETVQQSANNMQAVIESASIVAGGLQDVAGEWIRFAQTRLEQNLDHLDQLRECRSLQTAWRSRRRSFAIIWKRFFRARTARQNEPHNSPAPQFGR